MLYNIKNLKVNHDIDCFTCPYHDNKTNRCKGFGTCCFPMDAITGVVLDPLTDKALTEQSIQNIHNSLKEE